MDSPLTDNFEWPTDDVIRKSQRRHAETKPTAVVGAEDGGLMTQDGKTWIHEDANLQIKLLVVAHCGACGHRGIESTKSILSEGYIWEGLVSDCQEFVKNCLRCLVGKGNHKVPRTIVLTLHGTRPNEVLHFDFLYQGHGTGGFKYVLALTDDLSSYNWRCPTEHADAKATAQEISRWIRTFTAMDFWVNDQGSHLTNELIKCLVDAYKIKHDFTIAYSPWVNGTVERVIRTVRSTCSSILSEMKLGPQDWPLVIGMVMTALNEAPLSRLGKRPDGTFRSPLEVFTGRKPARTQMLH